MKHARNLFSLIGIGVLGIVPSCMSGGCGLAAASLTTQEIKLVATGTDVAVTSRELDQLLAGRLAKLRVQEYELKRQVLEEHLARMLLKKEASALNISPEELEKRQIQDRIQAVSKSDVQAFVEKNKARFASVKAPNSEVLRSIREGLERQRREERRQDYYRELLSKANVQIRLEPPRVAVRVDDHPAKGPATAPVTILEFSDFQCPYCSRAAQLLKQIEQRYKSQVRIVFRDFPLPMHKQAAKAAEAAGCANEQGRFWSMHDSIFENQKGLETADLKRLATEIGLNRESFDRCLDSDRHSEEWKQSIEDGKSYGVSGTPTLFINGRLIIKPPTYEYLVSVIDEELAGIRQNRPLSTSRGATCCTADAPL